MFSHLQLLSQPQTTKMANKNKRPFGISWRGPDDKFPRARYFAGDVVQPLEVFGGERHETEDPRHHKADVLKDGARRHAKEEKGRRL